MESFHEKGEWYYDPKDEIPDIVSDELRMICDSERIYYKERV